ncbi:MAG: hypothetical protein KGZ37_10185 [Nitrosarchaeum sp.]|nr:hypothetical protein [Nitrosarchaeum sp.]
MNFNESQSEKIAKTTPVDYECSCNDKKKIKVVYDGGFDEKFAVEYCDVCYEQEDKRFMISMERLQ